jgi:AraC-like DNA-binding protein
MTYREIKPCLLLKAFVKCYYIYEASSGAGFDDYVFPSGCAELIFNLGSGNWQIAGEGDFVTTPPVELWGQVTVPLRVRSIGKNTMLGIRFFPHGASVFLKETLDVLNNRVVDYRDVSKSVKTLYRRLQETADWSERISLVEEFLLESLAVTDRNNNKLAVVNNVMEEMKRADFFDNIDNVASRYGITSRYLQKLFLQYTGLTPKLYQKIHHFQNSLKRVTQKNTSFTDIAYDCGYFDQSHFIREFKSFTGFTPSAYNVEKSPINLAFSNQ